MISLRSKIKCQGNSNIGSMHEEADNFKLITLNFRSFYTDDSVIHRFKNRPALKRTGRQIHLYYKKLNILYNSLGKLIRICHGWRLSIDPDNRFGI